MIEIRQHPDFAGWLRKLKDRQAQTRIAIRLVRLQSGLMGDVKYFGGIGEVRIDYGPGYRLYFVRRGEALIILLCGGDKASQEKDIRRAMDLAKDV
ncbi:type II toxin-antitoxin system RelE/ParE family toxin [Ciceribacter thiooxidans]|uniref:Type II toxin-antitoxin system RelE/ParE family toxin n=1 Tax=Ciceribacter thiooxidans TaxID=1969821 RepID=A0ABV7I5T4_9HYPH|nr:type II toxin-antitoxin system RelE/ParE family toxin [Ciceribacter thiooxidans]MDI6837550.1 type II toxin-antitoxin system RelE/ParE family toxin [Rhizobiaceae bacterium]HLP66693.1 type II toxin-antitoxin system RelE/ParE family toxin [Rhizobium sp.]